MRKFFAGCLLSLLLLGLPALSLASQSLKDSVVVYETDENTAEDSLERISGHYDLGFSMPSQSYKAESRKKGPFADDSLPEKLE